MAPPKKMRCENRLAEKKPLAKVKKGGWRISTLCGMFNTEKSHVFLGNYHLFVLRLVPKNEVNAERARVYSSQFDINHWAYFFQNARFCWCPPNLARIGACRILHANLQTNQALPNSRRLVLISHINVTFQFHFRIWLRYSCYCLSSATASHWGPL